MDGMAGKRLYEQVARKIALQIMRDSNNGSNETLPVEAELCRSLGVSRTVLREAIKVLSAKGLLEVSPKRGTTVQPRQKWNLLDRDVVEWYASSQMFDDTFISALCEFRQVLEPAAAELAAERATQDEVIQLSWHLDEMEMNVGNDEAFVAADLKFHALIFSIARNDFLRYTADAIGGALRASRSISVKRPGSSRASLPIHRNVADAIRNHDPVSARAAMLYLVRTAARDIYQVRLVKGEHK